MMCVDTPTCALLPSLPPPRPAHPSSPLTPTPTPTPRDASADIPRLCGVAINAYLTMLLDTGTLHCDPHPGNLLRTKDGRLCILDWGMTLDVPDDLQYGLLEFIAHVNSEDYDAIPKDFVNLGFTPPDKLDQVCARVRTHAHAYARTRTVMTSTHMHTHTRARAHTHTHP